MTDDVDSRVHDKRPPWRIPRSPSAVVEIVQVRTLGAPPRDGAIYWTASGRGQGSSVSLAQRVLQAHGLHPHQVRSFTLPTRSQPRHEGRRHSPGCMSMSRPLPECCQSTKKARSRHSTGLSQACQGRCRDDDP
jgi:hypothetical protein